MNYKDILAMASAYKQVAEASSCKKPAKEAMDPVDAKELKGKHKDRKDKDIDNDGDVDKSDEYLHKRRKAVSASIKGKKKGTEVETEVQESVELDELSKKTLGAYVKKAAADMSSKDSLDMHKGAQKRYKGIVKATDKLTKESFDLSDFTVEELEDFMMTEDFAQLDELSKKTLGSYVKKASADKAAVSRALGYSDAVRPDNDQKPTDRERSRLKTVAKRETGISKAIDKLTKEAKDHGNMNNGSPRGEGLSPSAKKELARTTPMNPATDELAVNNLNFKTFKAMAKKAPMRSNDNAQGDKTPPKAGK